jgi:hypothetical protein
MFRRVRWFAAGAALGAGATVWAERKVKGAVARYRPAGLAGTAVDKALAWPAEVRAAIDEGRSTMRQREAELRHDLVPAALHEERAAMRPRRAELAHGLQRASRP